MNPSTINPIWHTHHFRAMGSNITIWLECDDAIEAEHTLAQAERFFQVAERRLTRFSSCSELSQLNTQPEQWVAVSTVLWQLLHQAVALAEVTGGLFDPTMLNALETAGYSQSFEEMAGDVSTTMIAESIIQSPQLWREIGFDYENRAVWLPAFTRLDFGGIGKGYIAQEVVAYLSHWGACLVDAGGDLIAGDAPMGSDGWLVGVSLPFSYHNNLLDGEDVWQLYLANQTLATSGVDYRQWEQNGVQMHHLIDPQTARPAQTDLLTATILSDDSAHAEAWATATLIAGNHAGRELLESEEIAGILIDQQYQISVTSPMPSLDIHTKR